MRHPLIPDWPWYEQDTVTRQERLKELAFAGHKIPRCGPVKVLARRKVPLVVYDDGYAHCGTGKRLVRPDELRPDDADKFCSEFIHQPPGPPSSMRLLVIGTWAFATRYESDDAWRSNVGAGAEYELLRTWRMADRDNDLLRYPMYAIDFVGDDKPVAIDLNVCPGVPLEVINSAGRQELIESLKEFKP